MKKGRHRRYEEARALKHTSVGSIESLIKEHDQNVDPELLAKWPEFAADEEEVDQDNVEVDDSSED